MRQDDASTFSVAQGIRGNLQAFSAVQGSLANGVGLGTVTQAALTNISDLVGNLQAKITQLADGSIGNSPAHDLRRRLQRDDEPDFELHRASQL